VLFSAKEETQYYKLKISAEPPLYGEVSKTYKKKPARWPTTTYQGNKYGTMADSQIYINPPPTHHHFHHHHHNHHTITTTTTTTTTTTSTTTTTPPHYHHHHHHNHTTTSTTTTMTTPPYPPHHHIHHNDHTTTTSTNTLPSFSTSTIARHHHLDLHLDLLLHQHCTP